MTYIKMSINQLVDFNKSSLNKKLRIIKDQKKINPFRIGWYQTPRSRFKRSFGQNGNIEPILEGIDTLKKRVAKTPFQINNKMVSLEAMQRYLKMEIPKILRNPIEVYKKTVIKSIYVNDVEITVSPDIVFTTEIDDETYMGAVKFHISKGNIFDREQSTQVAAAIYKYLNDVYSSDGIMVLPELCASLDVFGGTFTTAPENFYESYNELENACEELKILWLAA